MTMQNCPQTVLIICWHKYSQYFNT